MLKKGHRPQNKRRNMKQSEAKQDEALCVMGHEVLHNVVENRRSANYKPNIWKYDFLQSLTSKYDVRFSLISIFVILFFHFSIIYF